MTGALCAQSFVQILLRKPTHEAISESDLKITVREIYIRPAFLNVTAPVRRKRTCPPAYVTAVQNASLLRTEMSALKTEYQCPICHPVSTRQFCGVIEEYRICCNHFIFKHFLKVVFSIQKFLKEDVNERF